MNGKTKWSQKKLFVNTNVNFYYNIKPHLKLPPFFYWSHPPQSIQNNMLISNKEQLIFQCQSCERKFTNINNLESHFFCYFVKTNLPYSFGI